MITILGLGAGELEQMPLGVYRQLQTAKHVFFRTTDHPVVANLIEEGVSFTSFDSTYELHDTFEAVYDDIVAQLMAASVKSDVIYAVPGHPMVAERVVQLLIQKEVEVVVAGGQSFLDAMFNSLKIDPIEGFLMVDGTSFHASQLNYENHLIICQVYDQFVAAEVKLTLLELLSPDYLVYIVTAAGTSQEVVKEVPLCELDFETTLNNLTSVYVPPVPKEQLMPTFASLKETVATLRGPNGCPWDKAQTHESLKKYLVEETEELLVALDGDDDDHVVEELGDVLLQVMLHARLGEEAGYFTIEDVIGALNNKLIRRHPHVFGDVVANSPEEAINVWNAMKKAEKGEA